ncbi:MAG: thiamine phosphate synthase [Desulfitobacterium hafniense]|nr:thiamine phosphate synthase [Desulfitobacterium hafniense]
MARVSTDKMRDLLKVYFIMGSLDCKKDPLEVLREAIRGGITLFQFREKGTGALMDEEKYRFAKEIQEMCEQASIPFIVNDDIELAVSLNADGVHIGQEDEAVEIVRKKIGDKILGVSVYSLEEAVKAIEEGADYLGLGPVFYTSTKKDAKEVQGTSLIKSLRENGIQIPIVGIGGITSENAGSVIKAGVDGVSVITAISLADSVIDSTQKLRSAVFTA